VGKLVSVIDLPEEVRDDVGEEVELTHPIGKIEGLIRQAESLGGSVTLAPAASAELTLWMTHEIRRMQVERVYWKVGAADFRGVVEGVRTALVELVAEMRAGTEPGAQSPAAEVAAQAVQVAIYGDKNRITLNTAMAKDGGTAIAVPQADEADQPGFWTTTRLIWGATIGIATTVGAVAACWRSIRYGELTVPCETTWRARHDEGGGRAGACRVVRREARPGQSGARRRRCRGE
jgi:hypothetical protein